MFGGGPNPRSPDPITPFRPAEIRGMLRFWWRATLGTSFPTAKELRDRQDEIWGSTEKASKVRVEVAEVTVKAEDIGPCAEFRRKEGDRGPSWQVHWLEPFAPFNWLPYALFPFQGESGRNRPPNPPTENPSDCVKRGSFRLILRMDPEFEADVKAAVWAWVNFGGLGARTRRGCGALALDSRDMVPMDPSTIPNWYERMRREYELPDQLHSLPWPTLPTTILSRPEDVEDSLVTWNNAIWLLRQFRQGEDFARDRGKKGNKPGRSRYPEPETIRAVTGSTGHPRLDHIPDDAFPRAELGLPIVVHFQGGGDPAYTTLYPWFNDKRRDRMASPVIIKPLALSDGGTIPVIIRLDAPGPIGLSLLDAGGNLVGQREWIKSAIVHPRLADPSYRESPLSRSPKGSAIDAFLVMAKSWGFK